MNHLAFQLKKCQSPPVVPQAEMLAEDEDFGIGNVFSVSVPLARLPSHICPHCSSYADEDMSAGQNDTPKPSLRVMQRGQIVDKSVFFFSIPKIFVFCHLNLASVVVSPFLPPEQLSVPFFFLIYFSTTDLDIRV